jgi:hypothetical protein
MTFTPPPYSLSDDLTRRPSQQYYTLELGVDKPPSAGAFDFPERVCAVEVGPLADMRQARAFAQWARGKDAADLLNLTGVESYDLPEDEIREQHYTIVGATFCISDDENGTLDSFDIY